MSNAVHAPRLAIALLAALALAACSQKSDVAAEGAGHASTEHAGATSDGLPTGRIHIGEQLAKAKGKATGQSCIDCHGADGNAPIDPTYPKLGGQYADYLAHALQQYRSGDRQNALMTGQATQLSDQDIADLAEYFGSRPSKLRDLHGL